MLLFLISGPKGEPTVKFYRPLDLTAAKRKQAGLAKEGIYSQIIAGESFEEAWKEYEPPVLPDNLNVPRGFFAKSGTAMGTLTDPRD